MDKQIIIDGVDVSGCSYGEIEKDIFKCSCEYNVRSASMFCKDNPNCHYKNWKRKEQECDELNKWLPIVTRLEEQFKSHEKAKSIGYKTYAEQVFTELDQLKAENNLLRKTHKTEQDRRRAYEQVLTEIKEIVEENCKQCFDIDGFQKFDDCGICEYKLILQKCEVLDE